MFGLREAEIQQIQPIVKHDRMKQKSCCCCCSLQLFNEFLLFSKVVFECVQGRIDYILLG